MDEAKATVAQRAGELEALQVELANMRGTEDDEGTFSCENEDDGLEEEFRRNIEVVRAYRHLEQLKNKVRDGKAVIGEQRWPCNAAPTQVAVNMDGISFEEDDFADGLGISADCTNEEKKARRANLSKRFGTTATSRLQGRADTASSGGVRAKICDVGR